MRDAVLDSDAFAADLQGPLGRLLRDSTPAGVPAGHSGFRLLHDGAHALDARAALAQAARRSLDVQYYVVASDTAGTYFLSALRSAAARGVRVRLLLDDLHADEADPVLLDLRAQANVEIRFFNPLSARTGSMALRVVRSLHEFSRINRRMHNKLFIADGVFSVSGGRNVADEYFMRASDANFIDMDVLAGGPVVQNQSAVFDRYWNSAASYPASLLSRGGTPPSGRSGLARAIWWDSLDVAPGSPDIFGGRSLTNEMVEGRLDLVWATSEFMADSPDKAQPRTARPDARDSVSERVLQAFDAASREIFLSSPYFIPGPRALDTIRAARSRNVQVTLVTNSFGASDEPLVHARYAPYRALMLDHGVLVYEISPSLPGQVSTLGAFKASRGRLHSKLAIVDRRWFFIGSMNFDRRSATLNTEAGLLIDSPELVAQFTTLLELDRFRSAYRVVRAPDGAIQWLESSSEGGTRVRISEPGKTLGRNLWNALLSLFIDEDWL